MANYLNAIIAKFSFIHDAINVQYFHNLSIGVYKKILLCLIA